MRPAKVLIRCTLLCLLFQSGAVLAQVIDARDTGNTIGVGALWNTEPYRGLDNEIWVFPPSHGSAGASSSATGLGFQVAGDENWSLDAFAELRFDGYDADDSDFLEGMDDRDGSLDAGLAVVRRSPTLGKFAFSIAGDTLDRHGGYQANVTWSTHGFWHTLGSGCLLQLLSGRLLLGRQARRGPPRDGQPMRRAPASSSMPTTPSAGRSMIAGCGRRMSAPTSTKRHPATARSSRTASASRCLRARPTGSPEALGPEHPWFPTLGTVEESIFANDQPAFLTPVAVDREGLCAKGKARG